MKVKVLGGSGGLIPGRLLTSFRINEDTILDAGSMAESLTLDEQAQIAHILLTHAHLDHSGTLPFFVDNIFGMRSEPFVVHSLPETIRSVREHLFNNNIWPDFSRIPDFKRASMRFADLTDELRTEVGSLQVTPVRVNHNIPCAGYILESQNSAVLFTGDTAATERLWEIASEIPNLKAAFVETSFPNRMQDIADLSFHLTPRTLALELEKLRQDVPVFVYHIKPRFHDEVVDEIRRIGRRGLEVVEQGMVYDFK